MWMGVYFQGEAMKNIVGFSLYVNAAYYETYESLSVALHEANRFNAFNEVEILPMISGGVRC